MDAAIIASHRVTPYTGVWIETISYARLTLVFASHPLYGGVD